jgi:hypothetical protein
VRVANGDLNARAPTYQDHALWQISIALNNLLLRLKSALQAEHTLRRVSQEVAQLRLGLRNGRSGQRLQGYPTSEMLLGPLVADLQNALTTESARNDISSLRPPYATKERQQGPLPTLPRSAPAMERLRGESDMRPSAARPSDSTRDKNTPLPDNSGFFTSQRSWDQAVPQSSPYRSFLDDQDGL